MYRLSLPKTLFNKKLRILNKCFIQYPFLIAISTAVNLKRYSFRKMNRPLKISIELDIPRSSIHR